MSFNPINGLFTDNFSAIELYSQDHPQFKPVKAGVNYRNNVPAKQPILQSA